LRTDGAGTSGMLGIDRGEPRSRPQVLGIGEVSAMNSVFAADRIHGLALAALSRAADISPTWMFQPKSLFDGLDDRARGRDGITAALIRWCQNEGAGSAYGSSGLSSPRN